jgi:5-methylcytosine-specific restriction protein B
MNPEDRSVDEIDAAMERRWAKIALKPDAKKVRDFLQESGAPADMIGPVLDFFNAVQKHIEIGHAYFRTVKDPESAVRLWNNQLQYVVRKRFRFDGDTRSEVEALWTTCETALKALPPQTATAPAGPKEAAA